MNIAVTATIEEIRLANARLLLEECGGQKGMIEKTGRSQSQISQIMGDTPSKAIGGRIARSLEEVFDKPKGWLDQPRTSFGVAEKQTAYTAEKYSEDELEVLELTKNISPEQREIALTLLKSMAKQNTKE